MKLNASPLDRSLRIVVGFVLLAGIVALEGNARWFGLVGIVPLLTGIFGYCPLYQVFGFSTCSLEGYKR
jgi:hypothetical protein